MSVLTPQIRAVFFDAVGTVLFPHPSAPTVYEGVARRRGLDLGVATIRARFLAAYAHEEQMDLEAAWVTSEQREENRWRNIVFKTLEGVADPESCFQELYQHFAQPASWRLGAEVGPVVATLIERGIRVGLGSNYDRRLLSVLAGFHELAPLREGTVISSIIGVRKPAGGFFQEVVRVASCHRQEILFLGDDLTNDYSGALAAGLRACLLDPARRTGVTFQIERLTELISA